MSDSPCPALEALELYVAHDAADAALEAHLDACADCARAVERIRSDNDLLGEFARANADRVDGESALPAIDGYELIEEIHRGAQGVVYRAIQSATHRSVAVKVIRQGALATHRQRVRFEREVELVAQLRHPGIVTVYDCGHTADGGHFLAMELIEGRTLDRLPPADDPRRWVRLCAELAEAVNAAHRIGILHRDLKPANLVVDDEGGAHVLDFGLAKRLDDGAAAGEARTVAGEFLGTFAYAAPEQVAGDAADVDIRADVYALGVILYERVVGRRPYELAGSVAAVVRAILESEPAPPSSINSAVDDELDAILLTALAKDRERRYQSAGALRDDLVRYLAGEPIEAKRDQPWYLLRKTMWRYRLPVAVATGFVIMLVAFSIAMAVLFQREVAASRRASDEAQRAGETLTSFLEVLGSDELRFRVDEETLPFFFERVDEIVSEKLAGQPATAAAVRGVLGDALLNRGDYTGALQQARLQLQLLATLDEPDRLAVADAHHLRGSALWWLGRYDDAEHDHLEALEIRRELLGEPHEDVAHSLNHLAATYRRQGRYDIAVEHYNASLEMRRAVYGTENEWVAATLNNLGQCLRDQRKFDEALRFHREALTMIERLYDNDAHPWRVAGLHNVGACLVRLERLDEADEILGDALTLKRRIYEDDHDSVARTQFRDRADPVRARRGGPGGGAGPARARGPAGRLRRRPRRDRRHAGAARAHRARAGAPRRRATAAGAGRGDSAGPAPSQQLEGGGGRRAARGHADRLSG